MPDIFVRDVTVYYKNKKETVTALNKINLNIDSCGVNVLVGCSGCGKSTLLRVIAGLEYYEGNILVDGKNIEEYTFEDLNIAMVFQDIALNPSKTIFDNIAYPLKLMGASKDEIKKRVHEVSEEFGITFLLTRKPKNISKGQQQRVQIAKCLIKNPNIILMDEPLSSIDETSRVSLRILIKEAIKNHGSTCLFVTHDIIEAMAISDKLFVMDNGKIVVSGKPLAVYNSGNSVVNALIGKESDVNENL